MATPQRRYEDKQSLGDDLVGEDLAELNRQLEETNKRNEEYLALAQRVQADFLNYKRRVEQEREEQARQAQARLALSLLPVLDDLERAMDSVRADLAGLHWVQGIVQINRKLHNVLESEGLERIDAVGQDFDPRLHEAVVHAESSPQQAGKVLAVLQNGYKLNGKVIRPAMVKVGRGSPAHRAPRGEQKHGATFLEEDKNA
ncbi:MAG: nucleotide exchange factor GrpE [Chloroflexi bacterium]|nr:nucleotide exchange factor GrpE [Chloroflexota bacterium]MCL5110429.1 nucleotide exchange factor GrpE [Chloroflexota bacterium]